MRKSCHLQQWFLTIEVLEGIMLSKVSQAEKGKYCIISHIQKIYKTKTSKFIEKEIRFVVTKGGEGERSIRGRWSKI